MSDENETTLRISERGVERIREMAEHVQEVASYYGDATRLRVAESFAYAMQHVFSLGGEIWAEGSGGDLSLGGRSESGLVYGVFASTFPAESHRADAPKPIEWSTHS